MFDDVSLDNTEKDNLEGTAEVTDMEDVPMEAEVAADWEEKDSKYPFDRDALWRRGMSAIDDNMDMIREDYLDKGYEEGKELDELLAQERAKLFDEFVSDFYQSDADDIENAEQEEFDSLSDTASFIEDDAAEWNEVDESTDTTNDTTDEYEQDELENDTE